MQVSPLCLGAMMFGAWGEPDHDTSIAIIHRALDAGINFIDTADIYSQGESEVIVGKAPPGSRRDDVILATKFHGPMDVPMGQSGGDPNKRGNSRRWIVREVDNSLRRLGTDWIDLYHVHRPDRHTDVEETLAALTDLQHQGKIRAFGCSTFPAHEASRHSGCRNGEASAGLSLSSRRTPYSCEALRPTCCPSRSATAWACCRGVRWPAAG